MQDGPKWFKVAISLSMLVALLFAAAFTGGLVERLIGRNLTGLVGRRAVPRSDHVVVVGLGQVGLRAVPAAAALRDLGRRGRRPEDGENVGRARELGLPVVIGRGADPSLLGRLSLDRAHRARRGHRATTCRTSPSCSPRARSRRDLRVVLRAGGGATRGETRSLERLGHVRDVHRIGAVYLAGLALGSAADARRRRRRHGAPARRRRRARAVPVSGRGLRPGA